VNLEAPISTASSVVKSYENRPDMETRYQAGSMIKTTKRLSSVKTLTGGSVIKDYRLTYEQSSHTQRARLKTLTECIFQSNQPPIPIQTLPVIPIENLPPAPMQSRPPVS
jgi:hypothetical protein